MFRSEEDVHDEETYASIILIFETFPCLREAHDMLCSGRLNTNPGHGLMNLIQRLPMHKQCREKKKLRKLVNPPNDNLVTERLGYAINLDPHSLYQ